MSEIQRPTCGSRQIAQQCGALAREGILVVRLYGNDIKANPKANPRATTQKAMRPLIEWAAELVLEGCIVDVP